MISVQACVVGSVLTAHTDFTYVKHVHELVTHILVVIYF